MTCNLKADYDDKWQVPLGLTNGNTLMLGSGDVLDLKLGSYDLTEVSGLGHS